jgi:heptaprenylglyceryl phosphate synthase
MSDAVREGEVGTCLTAGALMVGGCITMPALATEIGSTTGALEAALETEISSTAGALATGGGVTMPALATKIGSTTGALEAEGVPAPASLET